MSAIPTNYEMPVSDGGQYTKIQDGESVKLRILNTIETGWQYFTEENKPVRSRTPFTETPDIRTKGKFGEEKPKHIWVATVYNHSTQQVEIWNISQVGIQRALLALEQNADWGNLLEYDITVTRTKTGDKTEYSVVPNKPKPLDDDAAKIIAEAEKFDMDEYFKGA